MAGVAKFFTIAEFIYNLAIPAARSRKMVSLVDPALVPAEHRVEYMGYQTGIYCFVGAFLLLLFLPTMMALVAAPALLGLASLRIRFDALPPTRGGFGDFLTDKRIACQTDNVALRLLLWPHPLLPADGFIAPEHDAALLAAASARLAEVAHLNVSENPALASDLAAWLGRPFAMRRIKETLPVASRYSVMLAEHLTQAVRDAWQARTRLDMALWRMACAAAMPDADIAALTATVRDLNVTRYTRLLSRAA
jgi:hypothetical protein